MQVEFKKLHDATRSGPAPSYETRLAHLDRLEKVLIDKQCAMAAAVSADFGNRSFHQTLITDIFVTVMALRHTREHLRDWMAPSRRDVSMLFFPGEAEVMYQPVGVVGIVSTWNYPFQLAFSPLVGALAAGNRAMIKPSELAPESAKVIAEMVAEAFPGGEVIVINGGVETAEEFCKLPFDHLVFTGSTRVGKLVMRSAAENLVPVTLELGGKSPAIIGSDYSLKVAADRLFAGKLGNAGQACIAPDYVMVPEAKVSEFVAEAHRAVKSLYPTLRDNADYTSIVNDRQYERLLSYLRDAEARGARIIEINPAGETLDPAARKLAPRLILDCPNDAIVMEEEIFGPLLPVVPYRELGEAISYVNQRPRPLALYYFGNDESQVDRVLHETVAGGVTINDVMLHIAQDDMPFGGIGPSGVGHYHGHEGFLTFSKAKPVFRQARLAGTGLFNPPYGKFVKTALKVLLG